MYAFAQRPDTTVVDEPLYGFYLRESGADHPGREAVMASMNCNGQEVIDQVLLGAYPTPVVFFKHMTHHMVSRLPDDFMQHMVNIFFIRDPRAILRSYAKVIQTPTIADIGLEQQLTYLQKAHDRGYRYAILDAGDLLSAPGETLQQLCAEIGIPYYPEMLQWSPGPRKEDGVWAPYWYHQVHASTGFQDPGPQQEALPDHLLTLYEQAAPLYAQLKHWNK